MTLIEPAADDCLAIGQIETRCHLFGRAADAIAVERRLDAVARESLPDALAAAVASIAASHASRDVVIRIDRLELDLQITREQLETPLLPRIWAARIGTALAAAIARGESAPRGIARFAGHGAFVTAYLEHRFGVARHPDFAFPDFAALVHVPPEAAAAELLAARPAFLPAVARGAAGARDPAWLARRLGPTASARILDAAMPEGIVADAATVTLVRALITFAPPGWRALPGAAAALALVLGLLDAPAPGEPPVLAAIAPVARAIAAVARLATVAPAMLDLLAGGAADAIALLPLTADERREAAIARALFAGPGGGVVVRAIHAALGTDPAGATEAVPAGATDRIALAPPLLDSPFAGFALLLPTLRALEIDAVLSPAQARALIHAVLAAPDRQLPHVEALADLLLPFPIEPEPVLAQWPRARAEDAASATIEAWADHLLAQFAERLPGMRGSTPGYLRRQFLHVSGTLLLEPDRLDVRLVRPPLAIVLTIGALVGDLGALPWRRDRSLRILMP